jgi:hypothetical protein
MEPNGLRKAHCETAILAVPGELSKAPSLPWLRRTGKDAGVTMDTQPGSSTSFSQTEYSPAGITAFAGFSAMYRRYQSKCALLRTT